MRLRWFRANTIVQRLLKIFELKRSEWERCFLRSALQREKSNHWHLSGHLRDVSRLPRVWSDERCTDHFECPFPVRRLRQAATHRADAENTAEQTPTEGRMTRQNARSWLSMMVLSVFFRSFKTLGRRNNNNQVDQCPSLWADLPELCFGLHGDEVPLVNELLLQIVQSTLDSEGKINGDGLLSQRTVSCSSSPWRCRFLSVRLMR